MSGSTSPSKYDRWKALTDKEREFILANPFSVGTIQDDVNKALAEAQRRYPGTVHNGEGDAFRHCYWSALLTRDVGAANAKAFTDAHEDKAGNPAGEKAMDLHNNGVGIDVGKANPKASDSVMADRCADMLKMGRLQTAPTP
jgi:hypothetical protein